MGFLRLFLIFISAFLSLISAFSSRHISSVTDISTGKNQVSEILPITEPFKLAVPITPLNLDTLETSFDYVLLIWEDVSEDETDFIIERHIEGEEFTNYDTVEANSTIYIDYRVQPQTLYFYRIKAVNTDGESEPSNEALAFTRSEPHSVPLKPFNLQGSFDETTHIILNWEDRSDNEEVFFIYRGTTLSTFTLIDSVTANTTAYSDYSIDQETTYYYYMIAKNSFGISETTDTIEIKVEEITFLESPILSINSTSSSDIQISWNSVPGNSIDYQVLRFMHNSDTMEFEPVLPNEFNDTDLNANTTYYYQILATDASANQSFSNIIQAKTLPGFVANRVSDSLIAMFILSERSNNAVPDFSWYGDPVKLNIADTLALEDNEKEALRISAPNALISLPQYNNKIPAACKNTDELSLECWLKTSENSISGPTTVLTFGNDSSTAFSLNCQPSPSDINKLVYSVNLSTKTTGAQGYPTFVTNEAIDPNVLNHIIFSHEKSGVEKFFINGHLVAEGYRPSGFDNWQDTYTLVLANDIDQQQPWLGELYMCSIYNTALTIEDISSNYKAAPFSEGNYIFNSVDYRMELTPNPATEYVNITITDIRENSEITERYHVNVVNQYGQVMLKVDVSDHLNGEPYSVFIDHLPPGLYLINLYNQHVMIRTEKLLITR